MIEKALQLGRLEFHERADATIGNKAILGYVREHHLDLSSIGWHAGGVAILGIEPLAADRFEFTNEGVAAFVCEALGADGETVADLIAWRLDASERPMTMFGRCGLLGLWQAMAPGTYFMGGSLRLHRTPLLWLQSRCDGAAIVDPFLAGRQLLEAPGRIAVADREHGREVARLLRDAADIDNKVIAPALHRRTA